MGLRQSRWAATKSLLNAKSLIWTYADWLVLILLGASYQEEHIWRLESLGQRMVWVVLWRRKHVSKMNLVLV